MFDQTIPIVGMPLLFTIGVTVAIAYELPSKPWYHYIKDIRKNIQTSAYLLRKDQNVSQLTYTDQATHPGTPDMANLLNVAAAPATYSYSNPGAYSKHSYYYKDTGLTNPVYGDKTAAAAPWNRVSPNSLYYASPTVGAHPGLPTKLQPVSNKMGYYFGQPPNQAATSAVVGASSGGLASVGNQLSQWMKLLPLMKPKPQKPIYWSDVVKG